MPRGNGTGPMGMGSGTGRAAGFCAGYSVPGYANPVSGHGAFGRGAHWMRGSGGGRGHRYGYYATGLPGWQRSAAGWAPAMHPYTTPNAPSPYPVPSFQIPPEEEAKMIRNQIEMMEEDIKAARERLGELETKQG